MMTSSKNPTEFFIKDHKKGLIAIQKILETYSIQENVSLPEKNKEEIKQIYESSSWICQLIIKISNTF